MATEASVRSKKLRMVSKKLQMDVLKKLDEVERVGNPRVVGANPRVVGAMAMETSVRSKKLRMDVLKKRLRDDSRVVVGAIASERWVRSKKLQMDVLKKLDEVEEAWKAVNMESAFLYYRAWRAASEMLFDRNYEIDPKNFDISYHEFLERFGVKEIRNEILAENLQIARDQFKIISTHKSDSGNKLAVFSMIKLREFVPRCELVTEEEKALLFLQHKMISRFPIDGFVSRYYGYELGAIVKICTSPSKVEENAYMEGNATRYYCVGACNMLIGSQLLLLNEMLAGSRVYYVRLFFLR